MKKLTEDEIRKAFYYWYGKHNWREQERSLVPFLDEQIKPFKPNQRGGLKKARLGLFLSAKTVAQRLKVARAAYSKYEENEENGSITLATLAKAAEAMDCELVYAIRPKVKKPFSELIWAKILPNSLMHPWLEKCDQKRRWAALASIASQQMTDSKFRKLQGWSQRTKEVL